MSLLAIAAVSVGLHLGSVHVPAKDYQRNTNPGVFVMGDEFVGGVYANSIGRTTVYGAYRHELGHGFSVAAGLGTGYQEKDGLGFSRGALAPVVALIYESPIRFLGASPVVFLVPGTNKSSTVANLGLKWSSK